MPYIIHRYLTNTKTNPQPPGFADFLRGTITLYQYSKEFNYEFKLDIGSHPIFKFLDIPELNSAYLDSSEDTIELLPPVAYHDMPRIIENLFSYNNNINILTNAYYKEHTNILNDYQFIKSLLNPKVILTDYIKKIQYTTKINYEEPYIVIHVREGDNVLVNKNIINTNIVKKVRSYIQIIKLQNKQILLIADSHQLKQNIIDLCETTKTIPIHTGSLDTKDVDERLLTTLGEFFIMSKASKIYCINHWDGSGYSRICSKLYSIEYECLPL